jgi:4-amino-4-deoxy-L-arabinose transferase-like glycosyltransferase
LINLHGYNSDEAVYAGQAAGIVGNRDLQPYFPVFRAHPLLFQFVIALAFSGGVVDVVGRYASVAIGLATICLAFLTGSLMYGRRAGFLAAAFLAVMPYHVVVTRQVLLDGPLTFCSTLALYFLARHATTQRAVWFYAAAGAIGLAFESKETAIILIAALYAYLALSPEIKVRLRDLVAGAAALVLIVLPFPLSLGLAGGGGAARTQQYLVWQLLRRPNHDLAFYPTVVPPAMGLLLIITVAVGLVIWRRQIDWRERLLLSWSIVPTIFFEIWPVKGFQYLLLAAPPLVVLGASVILRTGRSEGLRIAGRLIQGPVVARVVAVSIAASLFVSSFQILAGSASGEFLAGTGGVPGGRELGAWIQENVPPGGELIAIGPSMANIIQFYGHRRAYGLSVSPNPLHRNPSYDAIPNPDQKIRTNAVQYIVWDSFSAARSSFFAASAMRFVERYHGRAVHTETIDVRDSAGNLVTKPVMIVYEVRP